MRIGLTCSTIEPALTQGKIDGIGIYTKTLLNAFSQQNLDVTPVSYPKFRKWINHSDIENGKIFPLPYTASTISGLIDPLNTRIYKKLNKQFDILHVTDHMIPRLTNVPIIATIHDALMFIHPEWYPSKLRGIKNWLRKKTFPWANHFITVSHSMIPELVKYMGIPEKKISVVHNGIAPEWYDRIPPEQIDAVIKKFQLPEKFLLFTGTLQPKKNVINIINAFLELPADIRNTYPLVITGKAGWGADDILVAINNLISQKCGYWLNYVSHHELRALYQHASLYLCPSLHEGFGYTLLEAFASKTPVITSNLSALPEVAGDAAYFVDPYSTNDIKNAIQHLLTNEKSRLSLVEKGLIRSKEFTLEKCVRETLGVYQRIL